MRINNVHMQSWPVSAAEIGALIDGLALPDDQLWPIKAWPPMEFDRAKGAGADGGHGPIRYDIIDYQPGHSIEFRFRRPAGFTGTHWFEIQPGPDDNTILRHVIHAKGDARFMPQWWIAFRWLHDAMLEDAMDAAELALIGSIAEPKRWSPWVRTLRWFLTRGGPSRRQPTSVA